MLYLIVSAPSSTPLGVQVQQTDNPGELVVSWLPPPRESHNGLLQGYHVKAVPRITGDPGKFQIVEKYTEVHVYLFIFYLFIFYLFI